MVYCVLRDLCKRSSAAGKYEAADGDDEEIKM